jgi:hypothetical protein
MKIRYQLEFNALSVLVPPMLNTVTSIPLNMEDQARWHIRRKAITGAKNPNYLTLFHLQPLRKVKPEAVTLIYYSC